MLATHELGFGPMTKEALWVIPGSKGVIIHLSSHQGLLVQHLVQNYKRRLKSRTVSVGKNEVPLKAESHLSKSIL